MCTTTPNQKFLIFPSELDNRERTLLLEEARYQFFTISPAIRRKFILTGVIINIIVATLFIGVVIAISVSAASLFENVAVTIIVMAIPAVFCAFISTYISKYRTAKALNPIIQSLYNSGKLSSEERPEAE